MPSDTVYLPDDHDAAVRQAVESGEYENRSKAMQAAVAEFFEVDE